MRLVHMCASMPSPPLPLPFRRMVSTISDALFFSCSLPSSSRAPTQTHSQAAANDSTCTYFKPASSTMAASREEILKVPAPWQCKAQVYSVFFLSNPDHGSTGDTSAMMYSPLEAESEFARSGSLRKGLAGLMVIRYSDTPVGPYDELLIIPGPFSYSVKENGVPREKKNSRITRIYVSHKHTTYNGRYSKSQCTRLLERDELMVSYAISRLEYSQTSRSLRLARPPRRQLPSQGLPFRHDKPCG